MTTPPEGGQLPAQRLITTHVCKTCGGKLKTGMRDGQPWIVCAKDQTHNGMITKEKYKARKQ